MIKRNVSSILPSLFLVAVMVLPDWALGQKTPSAYLSSIAVSFKRRYPGGSVGVGDQAGENLVRMSRSFSVNAPSAPDDSFVAKITLRQIGSRLTFSLTYA